MLATLKQVLCWASRDLAALCLIGACSVPGAAAESGNGSNPDSGQVVEHTAQIPAAGMVTSTSQFHERLLLVDINRQQLDQAVLVLEDPAGTLYLWRQDLLRWRFRPPAASAAIEYQGEKFFPLSALSDVSHVYDSKALTLLIEVRPGAFDSTRLTTRYDHLLPPVKPGPGGFFNYDLAASHSADSTQRAGQFELGFFNGSGVGTSNLLAENLGSHTRLTRLDTTWTVDNPEKLQTLRLGDAVNAPGAWGRPVRFGGIQYGTNFATQPGFVSFPPQSAVGQAVLPSTVDVFINNTLVSRQSVPPGPFSISNLPLVNGAGEVQLVVRDLLGREQIVTRPFYASPTLLREGLKTFSYEFGRVRDNFGIDSNNYGSWLGSGTYRRGVSENFTAEAHAEAMPGQATVGAGGDYLITRIGTLSSYLVGSHGKPGNGGMVLLGIDRQALPWSLGARTQWASSGFAQVGQATPLPPPVHSSSASLSYSAGSGGSIGFAYVGQHNRDQADTRIATLSYSVSLGTIGTFMISALRSFTGDMSTSIFALLSLPLDASTNLSFSSQSVRGGSTANSNDFTITLQHNLPMGEGSGYRLQQRSDGAREASYSYQNNVGTYVLDAAQAQGSTATRLSVSGGVAFLGGNAFPSRRIDQSFAVVRIPDYPNVRILADNQPAGRTDANGNALIPRLRAYDINVISIDQRDLPMDAEIGAVKVEAVPYFHSGIDTRFPIKRSRGATLSIQLEDGQPLPVGAALQQVGRNEVFLVGYAGEVYITGLGATTRLIASWHGQSCEFNVRFTPSADPLPDLGIFICKGVHP
ncbi:MAG: fimbria/pilus outer membrane usher protein [Proteobacteria bacterium]|nr:fimbria/pilus outer membrane usher protein [Pseudomonadota bacterium]